MLGIGLGFNRNNFFGSGGVSVQYFVRPTGTTYGTGDGTSYDNAWSGFSSINWTLLANQTLNVCGTFNELLLVQNSDVTIVGNNVLGAGIINGQSARQCLNITSYNNITINGLTCNNGLLDCVMNYNTIGNVFNNCVFDTSTNQTTQNDNCEVTYNNCTFKNGLDDGVSLHGVSTIVTINDCYFQGNNQAINSIQSGICYVNDSNFVSNPQDLAAYADSKIIAHRCTFSGLLWGDSSENIELYNSIMLSGETRISEIGGAIVRDCKYLGNSYITSKQIDITRADIQRCYFEVNTSTKVAITTPGNCNIEYCTFKFVQTSNVYAINNGAGVNTTINNSNFIGNATTGRGITNFGSLVVNNSIFTSLDVCVNPNGATAFANFNYCNTYLNRLIQFISNGATFVNTNNITTNPLFTDIANLDFRLQEGSGSIGTGATLTNAVGIESADWNSDIPTVTTKNQSASWNRGAYVN